MHMHVDPVHSPTPATPLGAAPTRVEITSVNANGRVDVRYVASRTSRAGVPVVAGVELVAGDRALLDHIDGDRNLPVVTAKLPADAFAAAA